MHVDFVAGDRLAAALGSYRDFGFEVLRSILATSGELGRIKQAHLVVDDVCKGGSRKREEGGDLHICCLMAVKDAIGDLGAFGQIREQLEVV